uniref:Uncharacterized protein n=1 Tax=Arundo donax TaxID=35708 RepID=A0A0A9AC53_ARUDO
MEHILKVRHPMRMSHLLMINYCINFL